MKRTILFLVLLAGLSTTSGYLMSKASWIGRVGMTFLHREYNFLKIWWQGAIAVYLVFIVLFWLHSFIFRRFHVVGARLCFILFFLLGVGGAYLTYDDFTNDFSHHLLKWRFHLGFYLIWAGWVLISLFFLFRARPKPAGVAPTPVVVTP